MTSTAPRGGIHPTDRERSRRIWQLLEPIHAVSYFSPEPLAAYDEAGAKGFWMGYVASRAAPLGPVKAAPVIAMFANFHPRRILRALPEAWGFTSPEAMLEARRSGSATALRRIWADHGVESPASETSLQQLTDELTNIAEEAPPDGRGLFAANLTVERVDDPVADLWRAATLLREHRGDGHVAAYLTEGLTGVQANLLQVGVGRIPGEALRKARAWDTDEWQAEAEGLADWGLLFESGQATMSGHDTMLRVEAATDRAAWGAFARHDPADLDRLEASLRPLADAVRRSGEVPFPNPMGLERNTNE
ncbi:MULTISPECIES: SCO6745 family protein [Candidatus Microthrix]|uniref:SalK n=1 Tax=Candidatus Neomicrothrix parvicella RN1 TaxID=1229780 RepID=R4Z2Z7_9ACTN|nr:MULTISPECIES: hypothetical protein [Microthrix]NLH67772.1 hypothetical protein [Candidatus Microthrix parvicella]MBK6501691.1 hypothetical protein [Candidatus Microthrix sp.]MBK7019026.1 hypothetical protein [Candidatus Microthrix sp.]MBK7321191.1 hypothetical protein [Candidatus Microthrix sp.]MBL0203393.1 hypothetical protein [Candidatus Microthrix sp.]